jgi:hypothetical protein
MLTITSISAIAAFLLIISFIVSLLWNHIREAKQYRHIPGVEQLLAPFINIPGIKCYVTVKDKQFYKTVYDVITNHAVNGVSKYVAYDRAVVMISDADHIKQVFVKKAKDYPKPSSWLYLAFDIFGSNVRREQHLS